MDIVAGSSAALAAGLGAAGIAAGVAAAFISRRLNDLSEPDPVRARYPLFAAAGFGVGLWAAAAQGDGLLAALTALLGWQLLLIAAVDGEHYWLPDRLTFPLFVTGAAAAFLLDDRSLPDSALGAVAGFAVLWLLGRTYRRVRGQEGLGGGDPFLLGALGAWVGWMGLPSVLVWASAAGLSVVAARAITGRRVAGDDRMPFGVFLCLGGWLTWLWGPLGL